MDKTAIKNFSIWARNKLIADISYKAGLLGITEKEIKAPLPQSTENVQFFDIGNREPYSISGSEIEQRRRLAEVIADKAKYGNYAIAYKSVMEEVAYTWFNRLIAIRFMEVNDYLPTRIRVLSSESRGKLEPDLVTHPFGADLGYTPYEKDRIMQLKNENKLNELFRMLFIKQCNALNKNLPELFEKTNDYTELLFNVSFTDKDGVVYHLVNDISEDDFDVKKEGQVEIIGWLYQYYNTEPKDETFALLKKNIKITKERIPSATQLFTPHWIVRYMVENSLGRLWLESHPNDELKAKWKYYLDEAEQTPEVAEQLRVLRSQSKVKSPEDIRLIDPCMGSGHILAYSFDILMQIYECEGYAPRDAAKLIIEKNIYGLDIDRRAYQLAYFSLMMKGREYHRKFLEGKSRVNLCVIKESNNIDRNRLKYFGVEMNDIEKSAAINQMESLLDTFIDADEYGSMIKVDNYNWELLKRYIKDVDIPIRISMHDIEIEKMKNQLSSLINIAEIMDLKYEVVITNPPYMGTRGIGQKLVNYIKENFPDSKLDVFAVFIEKCMKFTRKGYYLSLVTPESWMFITSFYKLRKLIINTCTISTLNHLGFKAFETGFGTVAIVMSKRILKNFIGTYIDLNENEKNLDIAFFEEKRKYMSQSNYKKIPGWPIAYWVKDDLINTFKNKNISDFGRTRQGMATSDNNRFLRFWHEVKNDDIVFNLEKVVNDKEKWFPYNKGGRFRKWYGTAAYIVNWENEGKEIKEYAASLYGSYSRTIKNIDEYFKEAIAWPYITAGNRFGARFQPKGFIFDVAGPSLFTIEKYKYYLCGLLSSKLTIQFMRIINPTMNYQVGDIAKIPVIYNEKFSIKINALVKENIFIAKKDWDTFETSWDFKNSPLIVDSDQGLVDSGDKSLITKHYPLTTSIRDTYENYKSFTNSQFDKLKANEEELNRIFIEIYGLQEELTPEVSDKDITIAKIFDSQDEIYDDIKGNRYILTKEDVIKQFISYAVGCMFGRYSFDIEGLAYAGGKWDADKYKTFIPDEDKIILINDEEYFPNDIVGLFVDFVKKVHGEETLEENLDFIAQALNVRGDSPREIIRNYIIKDFFKDHCKTYKKRPIYWLFDSGKQNGFKALIYMHRYDENTIGNLRIDYLHKMQRIYENEISRMQDTIDNSNNAREITAATKRKEKLIKQLQETKEYDEKISHLALERTPMDLDDGVKVNYEKVQTDRDGNKYNVLAKI